MRLNLPLSKYKAELKIEKSKNRTRVWDVVRRKFVVFGPEEMVRQLWIHYLIKEKRFTNKRISIERKVKGAKLQKRFDLVAYDQSGNPQILLECKSHRNKVDQSVFEQVSIYNLTLKIPYLCISNGIDSYCASIDFENSSFQFLGEVPISR